VLTIEQLRHSLTFQKGASTIDGTNNLVSAEVVVGANKNTKCTLVISTDQTAVVGDSFNLKLGYGSSLWTLPSKPTLFLGSSGSDVLLLEGLLKQHGTLMQNPGSNFDSDTRNAVILFQQWYGLTADGICGPATWSAVYRNTAATPTEPGRFYIDSFRRTDESITIDAVHLKINNVTNAPVTQVGLSLINSVADCGTRLNYPVVPDSTGTFLVGTGASPVEVVENKSTTSAVDLLFGTGLMYGNFHFLWDDRIFSRWFRTYWDEPSLPLIQDTHILDFERASTTIDSPRELKNILFKPSTFYDYTISYTTYGSTLDLEGEGYHQDATAATRRLRGATIEGIRNVASIRLTTYGRLGASWLPGRCIAVGNLDGSGFANYWVIREHSLRYSAAGFTSSLLLQAMQF
jgi:hypothetical protein